MLDGILLSKNLDITVIRTELQVVARKYWDMWLEDRGLTSQTFLNYSLSLNSEIFDTIRDNLNDFYYHMVFHRHKIVAILPLYQAKTIAGNIHEEKEWQDQMHYDILGESEFIHFMPMIDPKYIKEVLQSLPAYISYDIGYTLLEQLDNELGNYYCIFDYPIVLTDSREDYLKTIDKKHAKELQRLTRKNSCFHVVESTSFPEGYLELFAEQAEYRHNKDVEIPHIYDKFAAAIRAPELGVEQNRIICERAEKAGMLHVISLYYFGKLVAVNAAIAQNGIMCDYITVRDQDPAFKSHSLGIYLILLNIDLAHRVGCEYYDLGWIDESMSYKRQFTNAVKNSPGFCIVSEMQLLMAQVKPLLYPVYYKSVLNPENSKWLYNEEQSAKAALTIKDETIRYLLKTNSIDGSFTFKGKEADLEKYLDSRNLHDYAKP